MGTNGNSGTAITPEAAGYGGLKAISLGDTPIKLGFALATTTRSKVGVTLAEFRIRALAVGVPMWHRPVSVTDVMWFVRQPGTARSQRRGVTHVCAHRGAKGKPEACMGGHAARGEGCEYTFTSAGDGVRRWRNTPDAHALPAFDGDTAATVKAARAAARAHVAVLRGKGFGAADLAATKVIAWALDAGVLAAADLAGRKARKAKVAKVEPQQPPAVPPTGDDDEG